MKRCSKCGEIKPLEEFYDDKRAKDGKSYYCKECKKYKWVKYYKENAEKIIARSAKWCKDNPEKIRARVAKSYKENPEKVRSRNDKYYKENREKIRERQTKYYSDNIEKVRAGARASGARYRKENPEKIWARSLWRKYKITPDDWNRMFEEQGGCCLICQNPFSSENRRNIHVDHHHDTGEVRALLCNKCNAAQGLLGENLNVYSRMVKYQAGKLQRKQLCLLIAGNERTPCAHQGR